MIYALRKYILSLYGLSNEHVGTPSLQFDQMGHMNSLNKIDHILQEKSFTK